MRTPLPQSIRKEVPLTLVPVTLRHQTALLTTAPPTRFGISSYSTNLARSLMGNGVSVGLIRVSQPGDPTSAHDTELRSVRADSADWNGVTRTIPIVSEWAWDDPSSVACAAEVANGHDSVLVQHEFGLYPGADGESVLEFLDGIHRPVISVLHAVPESPSGPQQSIIEDLAAQSEYVVVLGGVARARLLGNYSVDPTRVVVIPHGAHRLASEVIGPRGLEAPILTWGLLQPGRGIEHVIEAIALLRETGFDFPYVVAGPTHPRVLDEQGESYRESLIRLAAARQVSDLVTFEGDFLSEDEVMQMLASAALVVIPYDSEDQVTSGVLVEALAAGRAVIATAFPHAIELAPSGAVDVVPHQNAWALAAAIADVRMNRRVRTRMESAARVVGRKFDWSTVGSEFAVLLNSISKEMEPIT